MFCVLKYYFVDFNGMFTSFQGCQIRQSENACALQSWENYYFSKQNISSNVLQKKIKHFGTNFVILNIFWKQKIVRQFGQFMTQQANGLFCHQGPS